MTLRPPSVIHLASLLRVAIRYSSLFNAIGRALYMRLPVVRLSTSLRICLPFLGVIPQESAPKSRKRILEMEQRTDIGC